MSDETRHPYEALRELLTPPDWRKMGPGESSTLPEDFNDRVRNLALASIATDLHRIVEVDAGDIVDAIGDLTDRAQYRAQDAT